MYLILQVREKCQDRILCLLIAIISLIIVNFVPYIWLEFAIKLIEAVFLFIYKIIIVSCVIFETQQ